MIEKFYLNHKKQQGILAPYFVSVLCGGECVYI